jgi:ComF family protein
MGLGTQIKIGGRALLDVFYPDDCQICHESLMGTEQHLCLNCANELPYLSNSAREQELLRQVFWGRVKIQGVHSLFNYQKGNQVQTLLHLIKYKRKLKIGEYFGEVLGKAITAESTFTAVVPVPLHPKKLRQRGYNQSTVIAKGISKSTGVPLVEDAIVRNEYNLSQTKFTKYDRWENVRQIFSVKKPNKLLGQHILLVDDVLTTGATLEACVKPLLAIDNCQVSIATLAARI